MGCLSPTSCNMGCLVEYLSGLVSGPSQQAFKRGFPKCFGAYQLVLELVADDLERATYKGVD